MSSPELDSYKDKGFFKCSFGLRMVRMVELFVSIFCNTPEAMLVVTFETQYEILKF